MNYMRFKAFMTHCSKRIGNAYFRTPRNTVKAFVNLLAVLVQNPETSWETLIGTVEVESDEFLSSPSKPSDDELASFKL